MTLTIYTGKKLASKMDISIRAAQYLLRDIKIHYDIKIVTEEHLLSYLKIPKDS